MRFAFVHTRDGSGGFDYSGYRLQFNTAYLAPTASPFTICRIAGHDIAMFVECSLTDELRALVSTITRPVWIDAVGHVEIGGSPSTVMARTLDPGTLDPHELAFAAAVVAQTHGLLMSTKGNAIRLDGRRGTVDFDFDGHDNEDDVGSWFGTVELA